ncbi:MAG: hypothetical protein H7X75_01460 [Burkholderiaceae bacterium]|nr:hypothetical protein [Burkholderiaceae bacterium]
MGANLAGGVGDGRCGLDLLIRRLRVIRRADLALPFFILFLLARKLALALFK